MTGQTREYLRPTSVVLTVPDPDDLKCVTDVQQGGTMQWRTETHAYPSFEIRFVGKNPQDDVLNSVFSGTDTAPVVLRLHNTGDVFTYTLEQFKKDGTWLHGGEHQFSVRTCNGCHP